jgi:exodeoxyribonuclease V alpha subunit
LDYDVVIVDEASMVDVALFAKLLAAIDPQKRLVLLGDKDQLASVEAGSLFGDLCNSLSPINRFTEKHIAFVNGFIELSEACLTEAYIGGNDGEMLFEYVVELKKSHRFGEDSQIGILSEQILKGNVVEVERFFDSNLPNTGVVFKDGFSENLLVEFVLGYRAYIEEVDIKQALINLNKLKVLCAVREGKQGVYHINKLIEKILKDKVGLDVNDGFYINRPVLVTKNDRELKLWNGDIGIIRNVDGIDYACFLEDDQSEDDDNDPMNGVRKVLPGYITQCETVFAMTIHKSQGSEYNDVMVVLPHNEKNRLLTRELFYTGVTRAKYSVIVQGPRAVVQLATRQTVNRASGITDRIK